MKYRISSIERVAATIWYIQAMPTAEPLNFVAGQYVEIILSERELLPLSIANAPRKDGLVSFYVRECDDPAIQHLFKQIHSTQHVRLSLAHGECIYKSKPDDVAVIFLAGGVGISQTQSLLEQAIISKDQRALTLYWGVSCQEGVFLQQQLDDWSQQCQHFKYRLIIRENDPTPIYQKVIEDFPDLSSVIVYSSGPWEMTDNAVELFARHELPLENTLSDRFAF